MLSWAIYLKYADKCCTADLKYLATVGCIGHNKVLAAMKYCTCNLDMTHSNCCVKQLILVSKRNGIEKPKVVSNSPRDRSKWTAQAAIYVVALSSLVCLKNMYCSLKSSQLLKTLTKSVRFL